MTASASPPKKNNKTKLEPKWLKFSRNRYHASNEIRPPPTATMRPTKSEYLPSGYGWTPAHPVQFGSPSCTSIHPPANPMDACPRAPRRLGSHRPAGGRTPRSGTTPSPAQGTPPLTPHEPGYARPPLPCSRVSQGSSDFIFTCISHRNVILWRGASLSPTTVALLLSQRWSSAFTIMQV